MFESIKNAHKLLGMNARNLEYIRPYNRKKAKRLADDKILSKRVLKKAEIPVPKLLAKIKSTEELENFDFTGGSQWELRGEIYNFVLIIRLYYYNDIKTFMGCFYLSWFFEALF